MHSRDINFESGRSQMNVLKDINKLYVLVSESEKYESVFCRIHIYILYFYLKMMPIILYLNFAIESLEEKTHVFSLVNMIYNNFFKYLIKKKKNHSSTFGG